jgi:2-polyprenyl-3-methyl-5-hydroxy-6-metoxy-1,4-benzoquinol methylase
MLHQPKRQVQPRVISDPVEAYGMIAPVFAGIAERRKPYLDSVDRLVLSEMPPGARSLLDVGAGDGARARRLARDRGIAKLVLLEPSLAMQGNVRGEAEIWTMRAEELHSVQAEFDVITCLWNVLGHIFPSAARIEVLRQFGRLASAKGKIFIDVNHRYNASHYGALRTAVRFLRDRISPDEKNGDVAACWDVGETQCKTAGHVFTDGEFRALSHAAGLSIEERFVLDYTTGEQRRRSFEGHLLYVLRPVSDRSVPVAAR